MLHQREKKKEVNILLLQRNNWFQYFIYLLLLTQTLISMFAVQNQPLYINYKQIYI